MDFKIILGFIAVVVGFGLFQEAEAGPMVPQTGCFTAGNPGEIHILLNDLPGVAFADCIYVTAPNVVIDLDGFDVNCPGSGVGVHVIADDVTVMSGAPGSSVNGCDDGFSWDFGDRGVVEDVDASNNNFVGIRGQNANDLRIERVTADNNGGAGIFVDGSSNIILTDVQTNGNNDGTGIFNSFGADVTRLTSNDNVPGNGLFAFVADALVVRDSLLERNGAGVRVEDSPNTHWFDVRSRDNVGNGGDVIRSDGFESTDVEWSGNGGHGWSGEDAVTATMIRNQLNDNFANGANLDGYSGYIGVDNTYARNGGDGMRGVDSFGAQILRDRYEDNGGNGFHADNWDDVTCDDCGYNFNSDDGVFGVDSDNLDFTSGDASDNLGGDGFHLDRSDFFTCTDCLSNRNGGDGGHVNDSDFGTWTGGESNDNADNGLEFLDSRFPLVGGSFAADRNGRVGISVSGDDVIRGGSDDAFLEDFTAIQNGAGGVEINGGSDRTTILNANILDNTGPGVFIGFDLALQGGDDVLIENSTISGNSEEGILGEGVTNFTSINNIVTNNFRGLSLQGAGGNNRVSRGSYSSNAFEGIFGSEVMDLVVDEGVLIDGNQGDGIQAFNDATIGDTVSIVDAIITNNGASGVLLFGVDDATIDGTNITGNDEGVAAFDGINLNINNSIINNNDFLGLNIFNYTGAVNVTGTSISGNSSDGINIENSGANVTITFSSINSNGGNGIRLNNLTGNFTIDQSTVNGNATGGINSTNGGGIDITDTTLDTNGTNVI